MWKMLQLDKPEDFVIATGENHSIRDFINMTIGTLRVKIEFMGEGLEEKEIVDSIDSEKLEELGFSSVGIREGDTDIEIDQGYYRPTVVDELIAHSSKAKKMLNWEPGYIIQEHVEEMTKSDLEKAKKELVTRDYEQKR